MRVCVTGSEGFIGKALVNLLIENGYVVDRIDFSIPGGQDLSYAPHFLEIPDVVIHLAANSGVNSCQGNPKRCIEDNVVATANVLECMKDVGCDKLIFASSGSVYGECREPASSETELKPISWYGISKMLSEKLILGEKSIPSVILRLGNVSGAYLGSIEPLSSGRVIPSAVRSALRGEVFKMRGNATRPYASLDLVIGTIMTAVKHFDDSVGIHNVYSHHYTTADILTEVQIQTGRMIDVDVVPTNPWEPVVTRFRRDKEEDRCLASVVTQYLEGIKCRV